MTDTADRIPWWEEAKAQSLKRKAAERDANAAAQPGDSFLIVTEGTVTEPIYFDLLREDLDLKPVTVKVVPGWASDPRHVIGSAAAEVAELARRARKNQLANDEVKKL